MAERGAWALAAALLLWPAALFAQGSSGPGMGPGAPAPGPGCTCGAHPAGIPPMRTMAPYAGTPKDLEPFGRFAKPYYENYTQTNVYTGSGRLIPIPKNIKEVRIGFLGPIAQQADQVYGLEMLHGAQMAIDEANARGGYGGKPFRLMVHDDYSNWQFGAQGGETRPTDEAIWGAPIDAAVQMIYQDRDWAIFGSISAESTHMALRLALKAEIPIVNSASTDPTIPETYVPWFFTDVQDDRVQGYTLARRIVTELGLRRPALLRVNNRYGRMGVEKFRDAAVRLGHPVVIEQKYEPGQTDFRRELGIIRQSRADAIVIWGNQADTAMILKQMRAMGMKQPVFGSYRTLGAEMLAEAGAAAEGFEAVYPYDPTRRDPRWTGFEQRYEAQYGQQPEAFSALAYDAMNILLTSICKAGLNRARIQDALDQVYEYDGVTGRMVFDPNNKNVSSMFLGVVHNGTITYRLATMDAPGAASGGAPQPYARVGEGGVNYYGPSRATIPPGRATVIVFGPHAAQILPKTLPPGAPRTADPPGDHWPWKTIVVDTGQTGSNWGEATSALVQALSTGDVLVIVALDRDSAHLAEQLSLKKFVPVIALADDRALTSTNIPWIFRLPSPSGAAEALRVLAAAERLSGSNPEKLRDVLASGRTLAGVRFASSGEPLDQRAHPLCRGQEIRSCTHRS
ncbi:MAG TPA: ABC transporter substrate-binding protein [Acidobacteriaceae bacterium]|nr:ABC transporter substrate-binding protein [Acidobacteriaceae bacterium]